MRLLLLNISLFLLLYSCNHTQRNKTEEVESVYFDTLLSNGARVSVNSIKGVATYLTINGKISKKFNLKDIYNEFQIEANGIDLNYAIEKAGSSLYLLHSITNDFSFLINTKNQTIEKIFLSPIIALDTINAKCFYHNFLMDSTSLVIENLRTGANSPIKLLSLNDSIFFHQGFTEAHFNTDGSLYLKWKSLKQELDTIIKTE